MDICLLNPGFGDLEVDIVEVVLIPAVVTAFEGYIVFSPTKITVGLMIIKTDSDIALNYDLALRLDGFGSVPKRG